MKEIFDRDPLSAHAPIQFYQPRVRDGLEDGSSGNRGKGGASLSGHAHVREARQEAEEGAGRKRVE